MPADPRYVLFLIRQLRHTKGRLAGHPFQLQPWQEAWLKKLLAVDANGRRIIQEALYGIGRKNGKTELGAALAIALMLLDGESGGEILGVAAKREQAGIMLATAKRMVSLSTLNGIPLEDFIRIRQHALYYPEADTIYKTISADAQKEQGLNPHVCLVDELHAIGTMAHGRELIEAVQSAQGARENPLIVYFTTAGPVPKGVCWDIYQHGRKVEAGMVRDPKFLMTWYETPAEFDYRDPVGWKFANPALGTFKSKEFMERQVDRLPENVFRRLHLNQWTTSVTRWLDYSKWEACGAPSEIPDGSSIIIALDAALARDSFAVAWVHVDRAHQVEIEDVDEEGRAVTVQAPIIHAKVRAFVPNDGEYIDHDEVLTFILGLCSRYYVRTIVYDPAYMQLIANQLRSRTQVPLEAMPQSAEQMVFAAEVLQGLVLEGRLRHGNDPVLNQQMASAAVRQVADRGVRISKGDSGGRIDAVIALAMALAKATKLERTGRHFVL